MLGGEFLTKSAAGTLRLAKRFGRSLKGAEVVFLIGELGAGKTVFAKGIAAGLGLRKVRDVCSPTFTLLNVYKGRVPIYHLDLYRLGGREEIRDLGFEDYIGEGVILVEWGEKIDFPLPAVRVTIRIESGGRRRITIDPGIRKGDSGRRRMNSL
ncbi:MAG: tRNA (adenosine(37)-N6)-threonylcarbamoyltransferase complex ATPase subunit type 1 TsaE [Candidatus Aminicenantes bacterium]|nr:tRNA (adenosine(37)-N6)-threonylcarbamoyltransferase complex ATPase subunit type 1 TsaE [Candidatus Aminicenantes bacterium]